MSGEIKKKSLTESRNALEKNGSVYTDEEVIQIRDFLYRMAELDHQVYLKSKQREAEFKKGDQQTTDKGIEP